MMANIIIVSSLLTLTCSAVSGQQLFDLPNTQPFGPNLPLCPSISSHDILVGFSSPGFSTRPKFRYWLPDASVDVDILKEDISSVKQVGAGGIQLMNYYNFGFGDPRYPPVVSWDEYGFAGEKYKEVFRTFIDACAAEDLVLDFGLGANQAQGVPAEPLTPGLAVHLALGETTVRGGETFDGAIPGPNLDFNFKKSMLSQIMAPLEDFGPNKLVGLVAGGIISSTHPDEKGYSHVTVDESSLIDLTRLVVDGSISWVAPADHDEYALFAVFERYTNQRSCPGSVNAQDIIGKGSWITDHFSAEGAKLVIDLWETNLLDDEIREKLRQVGSHSWEDSMEMLSGVFWGTGLLERWVANRGYSPVKYLPFLFQQSSSYRAEFPPYDKTYVLGDGDPSEGKYLQDYRQTMTEGYLDYLGAFEDWMQTLGMNHSAEVSYHMPVDMSATVSSVGLPELESLAFPEIDHCLQFTGAAHISGRNIISSELGAEIVGSYKQTIPRLVSHFNDEFAAGVNMMVVHGMPYTGEYMSKWPGYSPGAFLSTELWSPRVPGWTYLNDSLNYAARTQLVLQTGVPRRDVAFYYYQSPWHATVAYEGSDLRAAGYSYEYLGPQNVADHGTVVNGILAPEGPGYQALVLYNQQFISAAAAEKLVEGARNGLPVLVVGDLPGSTIGTSGQHEVSKLMATLGGMGNVEFVGESETLAEKLTSIGVKPRVAVKSPSSSDGLWTFWRSTDDINLVYLYNKGASETFSLTFNVNRNRVPYKLDAWTGKQTPLAVYGRNGNGVVLSLALAEGQTAIIGFNASQNTTDIHVTSHSEAIEAVEVISTARGTRMVALIKDLEVSNLTLSDGRAVEISNPTEDGREMPTVDLGNWNLALESWVPGSDESSSRSVIQKIDLGILKKLLPWSDIPVVANVSGVGIYTTSFHLPQNWGFDSERTALYVHFGEILDGLRAWVNGHVLPPLDSAYPEVDVAEFLVQGENEIRVETSSTLHNAVQPREGQLESVGMGPFFPGLYAGPPHTFGLVGPVTTRVLRKVTIDV